jgi:hypothetical protein
MNGFDSTLSQAVLQDSKHMGLGIGEYQFFVLCLGKGKVVPVLN